MSDAVETKIARLEFQNEQFEQGVKTSIKSLENLKKALELDKAVTSLDSLEKSVTSLAPAMERSAGLVSRAAEMMLSPVQRFMNQKLDSIMHTVSNKAEQLVKAVTVEPLKEGFSEYETKIQSVQTITNAIKNNAKYNGDEAAAIADINVALDELNTYADRTIYKFSDMTQNVGKFVQQTGDLEKSTDMVMGLYNAAAYYGLDKNQGARIAYNLSQAMGVGHMMQRDWFSFENAQMASKPFKQLIIDTAKEMKLLDEAGHIVNATSKKAKEAVVDTESFRDTLQFGWFDSSLMERVFLKFSDGTTELGQDAMKAATEVKTLSQMFDNLKEAMGSGWGRTWQLLIGDYGEAKGRLTGLSEILSNIIDYQSELRNNAIEKWLGTGEWGTFTGPRKWDPFEQQWTGGWDNNRGIQQLTIAFENLGVVIENVYGTFDMFIQSISNGFKQAFGGEAYDTLTEVFGFTPESLMNMTASLAAFTEQIREAFSPRTNGNYMDATYHDIQEISKAFFSLAKIVSDGVTKLILPVIGSVVSSLAPVASSIIHVAGGIGKILSSLFGVFNESNFWDNLFAGIQAFNLVPFQTLMNGVAAAIDAVGDALYDLVTGKAFMDFKKTVTEVFGAFAFIAKDIGDHVKNWAVSFKDTFKNSERVKKVWSKLKGLGAKVRDAIFPSARADDGKEAGERILSTWEKIKNALKNSEELTKFRKNIKETANKFLDNLPGYIDKVEGKLRDFKHKFDAFFSSEDGIGGKVKRGFNKVTSNFKEGGKLLLQCINSLWDPVEGWEDMSFTEKIQAQFAKFEPFLTWLSTKFTNVLNRLLPNLQNEDGTNKIIEFARKIKRHLQEGLSILMSVFKDLLTPLEGGESMALMDKIKARFEQLTPFFDWLGKEFSNFVEKILFFISPAAAAEGETNEATGEMEVVEASVENLMTGLEKIGVVTEENHDKVEGILTSIGDFFGVIKEKVAWVVDQIPKDFDFGNFIKKAVAIIGTLAGARALWGAGSMFSRFGKASKGLADASGMIGKAFETFAGKDFGKIAGEFKLFGDNPFGGFAEALKQITEPGGKGLAVFLKKTPRQLVKGMKEWRKAVTGGTPATLRAVGALMLELGATIGIVAGSIWLIAQIPEKDLWRAVAVIGGIAIVVTAIAAFASKLKKATSGPLDALNNIGVKMFGFGVGLLALAAAMSLLLMFDVKKLIKGFVLLGALMVEMAVFTRLCKNVKFGTLAGLAVFSVSLIAILVPLFALGLMPLGMLAKGLGALEVILLELASFSRLISDNFKVTNGLAIASLAAGLTLLMVPLAVMSFLPLKNLAKGVIGIGAMLFALAKFSQSAKSFKISSGVAVMFLATALLALTGVVFLLSRFKPSSLSKGIGAIGLLLLEMGAFMKIAGVGGWQSALSNITGVLLIATTLYAAVWALKEIADMPINSMAPSVIALTMLMGTFAKLITALAFVGPLGGMKAAGALMGFVAVIGVIGFLLGALNDLDKERVILDNLNSGLNVAGEALGNFIHGFIGAVIGDWDLDQFGTDIKKVGQALVDFSSTCGQIDQGGLETGVQSIIKIADATTHIPATDGLLSLIFGGINSNQFATDMTKLGGALRVFSINCAQVSREAVEVGAYAIRTIANATNHIPEMGLLGYVFSKTNATQFATDMHALGTGLGAFAAYSYIVNKEKIGAAASAIEMIAASTNAIPDAGLLGKVFGMTDASAFATDMGKLGEGLGTFASNASTVNLLVVGAAAIAMERLAAATESIPDAGLLGKVFGLSDASTFASDMPKLGIGLAGFSDAISQGNFDNTKIEEAAGALASLASATDGISAEGGLMNVLMGSQGLGIAAFGEFGMSALGKGLVGFCNSINDGEFDSAKAAQAGYALAAIVNATAGIQNAGGLVTLIEGSQKVGIENFASVLPKIGHGIKRFAETIKEGEFNQTNIEAACAAIVSLAEASEKIPKDGGWIQKIVGTQDLSGFAKGIGAIGLGLRVFSMVLGNNFNATSVRQGAWAVSEFAKAAKEIPNEGGAWAAIWGDNSMSQFASKIPIVGLGLRLFNAAIGNNFSQGPAEAAAAAITTIAQAANVIPNSGGLWAAIWGDNDLGQFAVNMKSLGEGLAGFQNEFIGEGQTGLDESLFDSASRVLYKFSGLEVYDAANKMAGAAAQVEYAAKSFSTMSGYMTGIDLGQFNDFLNVYHTILDIAQDLQSQGLDASKVWETTDAMDMLMENLTGTTSFSTELGQMAAQFTQAYNQAFETPVDSTLMRSTNVFLKYGEQWMTSLQSAIQANGFKPSNGVSNVVQQVSDENFSVGYNAMFALGEYWAQGLAEGISSGKDAVSAAASSLAALVPSTTGQVHETASPSRVAMRYGMYWDQGLAAGLTNYAGVVSQASEGVADSVMSDSLGDYSQLLAMGINPEPVIRPVLDLSAVRESAAGLDGFFNGATISTGRIRTSSIGTDYPGQLQNGSSSDIYGAIVRIGDEVSALQQQMASMQVVMDTGTLVGQLAPGMDRKLASNAVMAGRGN